MLELRYNSRAPRRPPRVVLIGPPGSGRTTQSKIIADTFGLVHVSPQELVMVEAEKNPGIKLKIKDAIESGAQIPDDIMLRLVDARLRQSDCRVNGWILDGFPQTETQVNLLKSMRIKPSLVILFEIPQAESIRRLANRMLDPRTGKLYNIETDPPKSEAISQSLIKRFEDKEATVKKRFLNFNENISMLEECFKGILRAVVADRKVESVTENIASSIESQVL